MKYMYIKRLIIIRLKELNHYIIINMMNKHRLDLEKGDYFKIMEFANSKITYKYYYVMRKPKGNLKDDFIMTFNSYECDLKLIRKDMFCKDESKDICYNNVFKLIPNPDKKKAHHFSFISDFVIVSDTIEKITRD